MWNLEETGVNEVWNLEETGVNEVWIWEFEGVNKHFLCVFVKVPRFRVNWVPCFQKSIIRNSIIFCFF